MPNHTSNRMVVTADAEILEKILATHFDASGTLDLNTIVPMPEEIRNTEAGTSSYRSERLLAGQYSALSPLVPGVENCTSREEAFAFIRESGHPELVDAALRQEHLLKTYGASTWYDWAINNWGTKWGCYDGSVGEVFGGALEAMFQSAWSPPSPALAVLSEFYPDATFTVDSLDEGGLFAVTNVYRAGVLVNSRDWDWNELASEVFDIVLDDEDSEDEPEARTPPTGYRAIRLS